MTPWGAKNTEKSTTLLKTVFKYKNHKIIKNNDTKDKRSKEIMNDNYRYCKGVEEPILMTKYCDEKQQKMLRQM